MEQTHTTPYWEAFGHVKSIEVVEFTRVFKSLRVTRIVYLFFCSSAGSGKTISLALC